MLNRISARTLARAATCTAILALAVLDVRAGDAVLKYPDLSGQWGRDMLFLEPPSSGPGPVSRAKRKSDGSVVVHDLCCTIAPQLLLGGRNNPILKPEAAEAVGKFGELNFNGTVTPDLHNTCWPEPDRAGERRDHVVLFAL